VRRFRWDLLIHGQDLEQNFVKLCAAGLQMLLYAPLYSVKTHVPAFNRPLPERF
jgi:hypothetical protein